MTTTSIEWTQRPGTIGKTWNPTNGCDVCSPGCANCYAMRFAGRFSKAGERYHGLVAIAKNKRAVWTGESRFERHMLGLPLTWRKPCTVFVNSMSDLFYDGFSNEQIAAVFGVMAACPQHTFIILTKRARRMREWFKWATREHYPRPGGGPPGIHVRVAMQNYALAALPREVGGIPVTSSMHWPLRNVWIGVSVENRDALSRLDDLRACPASVRLVSFEPLLEDLGTVDLIGIGWAIVGCESGPGARRCDASWLRSLRDQCKASGVAFFLKQARRENDGGARHVIDSGPGSKVKAGGVIGNPYLDGVQHNAYPMAA